MNYVKTADDSTARYCSCKRISLNYTCWHWKCIHSRCTHINENRRINGNRADCYTVIHTTLFFTGLGWPITNMLTRQHCLPTRYLWVIISCKTTDLLSWYKALAKHIQRCSLTSAVVFYSNLPLQGIISLHAGGLTVEKIWQAWSLLERYSLSATNFRTLVIISSVSDSQWNISKQTIDMPP